MYASKIGLEIHIQLLTKSKIFCGCRAAFGDEPNTNVCPVCMGYPGVLPSLNAEAMRMAYQVALALKCQPTEHTRFARKNYFYPDLPKNYQISQFGAPIGTDGHVDIEFHGRTRRVRIGECHLEEDAGKMVHAGDMSLLDYNRAGTPLLEIVTEPDLEIAEEAEVLLMQLRRMVRYLGVCDGNMDEGSMRCDANVSVAPEGAPLGNKVEIKNLNSSRFVRKALAFEIDRQTDILERGGTVTVETRLWNENRDQSEPMRTKELAHDYRYFPEPDLPVVEADAAFLQSIADTQVELPQERSQRLRQAYDLGDRVVELLCDEKETADFFEATIAEGADASTVASWLTSDVRKLLNRHGLSLSSSPLSPKRLAELLAMLQSGRIHGKIAKQTLEAVFELDRDPEGIIQEKGWEQIVDPRALAELASAVIAANPEAVASVRAGNAKPLGFLVGESMKRSAGRAEPRALQQALKDALLVEPLFVLDFGGAIAGERRADGMVQAGTLRDVTDMLAADPELPDTIRFEAIPLGGFLSEEITPRDWAQLVYAVRSRVEQSSSGVVVSHGTDTLAYTAALLNWIFPHPPVPVVLTAAVKPEQAAEVMREAVKVARARTPGVYVVLEDGTYDAVNLRFERVDADAARFRTWNESGHQPDQWPGFSLPDVQADELAQRFERAMHQIHVARIYPGMRSESLVRLMDAGFTAFILELYDTGTANLGHTPFGLRSAFEQARRRGVRIYCTSQQEGVVDFRSYTSGHALWREGAVPMGSLTTESTFARLVAALVCNDDGDDAFASMEHRGSKVDE